MKKYINLNHPHLDKDKTLKTLAFIVATRQYLINRYAKEASLNFPRIEIAGDAVISAYVVIREDGETEARAIQFGSVAFETATRVNKLIVGDNEFDLEALARSIEAHPQCNEGILSPSPNFIQAKAQSIYRDSFLAKEYEIFKDCNEFKAFINKEFTAKPWLNTQLIHIKHDLFHVFKKINSLSFVDEIYREEA